MKLKLNYIRHLILTFCFIPIFLLSFHAHTAKAAELVTVSYEVTYHQSEAREMLSLVNEFRAGNTWYWNEDDSTKTTIKAGELAPLQLDPELERIAMKRASEIALFYCPRHRRPNGKGYYTAYTLGNTIGENIAFGQKNKDEVFIDWREEEEQYEGQRHRRNILDKKLLYVGIACAEVDGKKFWVQSFSDKSIGNNMGTANNSTVVVNTEIRNEFINDTPVDIVTDHKYRIYVSFDKTKPTDPINLLEDSITEVEEVIPCIISVIGPCKVPLTGLDIKMRNDTPDTIELTSDGKIIAKSEGEGQITYQIMYPMGLKEQKVNFEIEKMDISEKKNLYLSFGGDDIENEIPDFYYTGNPITPNVELFYKYFDKLEKGKDYTVEFKNNIDVNLASGKQPVAIIKGINRCKGKLEVSFNIKQMDAYDFEIPEIPDKTYTGKAIRPKLSIRNDKGILLVEGKDYILSYGDNIEVGLATVNVEYKGNYSGSKSTYFSIIEKEEIQDKTGKNKKTQKKNIKENTDKENLEDKLKYSNKSENKSNTKNSAKLEEEGTKNSDNELEVNSDNTVSKLENTKNKVSKQPVYQLLSLDGTVLLSVKKEKNVSYKIQYSVYKNMKKAKIIDLKKSRTLVSKLGKSRIYYIRIGKVRTGKISWSKPKKLIVKVK